MQIIDIPYVREIKELFSQNEWENECKIALHFSDETTSQI
jgi:hypothetical protein